LADLARLHGIEARLYLQVRHIPSWNDVADELEAQYHAGFGQHLRALRDLTDAGAALDDAGIRWLTFKGPVLADHVYRRPDLRSYSDVDLLVAPSTLRRAIDALEAAGAELADRNWTLIEQRVTGQVHLRLPGGTLADLHWHPFNRLEVRRRFPVDTNWLLATSCAVELDGRRVGTLDPANTIVHLCVHACLAGGSQLRWCQDIAEALRHTSFDWNAVVGDAQRWHASLPVSLMLRSTSRACDIEIPTGVVRRLATAPVWSVLGQCIDRASPIERWRGGRSIRFDVCRSCRDDDWHSTVSLARRYASMAKSRRRGAPLPVNRDPDDPASLHHPSGGETARDAYLTRIEADQR